MAASTDKRIYVIAFILFVDVLGSGLILPLLPFFADQMGATPLMIGLFLSAYPFFAILAGPFLGVLSDKYGRKPVLLFSIVGTVAGFLLLGVAKTLPMLFLSRVIDGASAGNTSTAKAAIADITSKEERVTKLGLTFAAESLGLILGPVIGGFFSQYGFTVAAYIAAGTALLCLLLTLFFFPETQDPSARFSSTVPAPFDFKNLFNVIRNPKTQNLILDVFIIQLLIMIMWGTLALYGKNLFGFSGKEIGYLSAFAAAVGIFSQTVILPWLTRVMGDKVIIIGAFSIMSLAMLLFASSQTAVQLFLGVGLMAACFNIAMPTVAGRVSRQSSENEQGNVMGTISSTISLASLVGPVFGNAIFSLSMRGNYLTAGVLGIAAVCLTLIRFREEREP